MRLIIKLGIFLASLLLIDLIAWVVIHGNLDNGFYPIDADSIGIPLMATAFMTLIGALLLAALTILSWLTQRSFSHSLRFRPITIALAFLLTISNLIALTYFGH